MKPQGLEQGDLPKVVSLKASGHKRHFVSQFRSKLKRVPSEPDNRPYFGRISVRTDTSTKRLKIELEVSSNMRAKTGISSFVARDFRLDFVFAATNLGDGELRRYRKAYNTRQISVKSLSI